MITLKRKFLLNLLLFLSILLTGYIYIPGSAFTQTQIPFAQQIQIWQQLAESIDRRIRLQQFSPEKTAHQYRTELINARDKANKLILHYTQQKGKQLELLNALGEKPTPPESESETIAKQRKAIQNKLDQTDNFIKEANLVIARLNESLVDLDNYQSRRIRAILLTNNGFLFSKELMTNLSAEFNNNAPAIDFTHIILIIFGAILLLAALNYSLPAIRKHFSKAGDLLEFRMPANWEFAVITLLAYLTILQRLGVMEVKNFPTLEHLITSCLIILLAILLFFILSSVRFYDGHKKAHTLDSQTSSHYGWLWNFLLRLIRLMLIFVPVGVILGYVNLAHFITSSLLMSIIALISFFSLRHLLVTHFSTTDPDNPDTHIVPLSIILLEVILASLCVVFALFFWGFSLDYILSLLDNFSTVLTIGDVTIDFDTVFTAIFVFILFYCLMLLAKWFLASRILLKTSLDAGVRNAITTVTGYVGIVIAVIAATSSLGLDMSNLAILASAFSVGIGFGLQTIINNFVSGLILLFERPVKVGDWIIVDGHQGIIRDIRVRATEISTFQNSSVIIPNSQIISGTVTNWTLNNDIGRIEINIGVGYDSDPHQIKELLLNIAKEHHGVRSNPAPSVVFIDFGDSALNFQLRCYLNSVWDMMSVKSDINFKILEIFRQHNIAIPFPQRDVHIIPQNGMPIADTSPEKSTKGAE